MIVRNVFAYPTAQMKLIEHDQVIEKFPATDSDSPLSRSILPGTRRAYAGGFHAARCQKIGCLAAELAITIENRVAERTSFRKYLPQLLYCPDGRSGVP